MSFREDVISKAQKLAQTCRCQIPDVRWKLCWMCVAAPFYSARILVNVFQWITNSFRKKKKKKIRAVLPRALLSTILINCWRFATPFRQSRTLFTMSISGSPRWFLRLMNCGSSHHNLYARLDHQFVNFISPLFFQCFSFRFFPPAVPPPKWLRKVQSSGLVMAPNVCGKLLDKKRESSLRIANKYWNLE